jgi:hypothetical protein
MLCLLSGEMDKKKPRGDEHRWAALVTDGADLFDAYFPNSSEISNGCAIIPSASGSPPRPNEADVAPIRI